MESRNNLTLLSKNICQAAPLWDCTDTIRIGQREMEIGMLAQNMLDQWSQYRKEDSSIQGRIETIQVLDSAFAYLARFCNGKEKPKSLHRLLLETKAILEFEEEKRETLYKQIPPKTSANAGHAFYSSLLPFSAKSELKNHIYRTVKNVDGNLGDRLSEEIEGDWQTNSFFGIKENLESFLFSYNNTLTSSQKEQIKKDNCHVKVWRTQEFKNRLFVFFASLSGPSKS